MIHRTYPSAAATVLIAPLLMTVGIEGSAEATSQWTPPERISAGLAEDVALSSNAAGSLVARWWSPERGAYMIATRGPGETWRRPTVAPTGISEFVVDRSGNITGVGATAEVCDWGTDFKGRGTIQAAQRPAGGAWGELTYLVTELCHNVNFALAVGNDGRVTTAWSGPHAARRSPAGVWEEPQYLGGKEGHPTAVAVGRESLVIWADPSTSVHAVSSSAGGDWRRPELVVAGDRSSHQAPPVPAVTVDGRDQVHIAAVVSEGDEDTAQLVAVTRDGGQLAGADDRGRCGRPGKRDGHR